MKVVVKDKAINWQEWQQDIDATLMFVVKGDEVLLIEKLTGIGQGKINGPGGKIDPGETAEEGVIRECQEELHIDVEDPVKMGELWFSMSDIPDIHCHVFMATSYQGEPTSTVEANPLWKKISEVPYEKMWADDSYWLPQMLAGQKFNGRFIFDGEKILWDQVLLGEEGESQWKGYTPR